MDEEETPPRVMLVGFLISVGRFLITALSLASIWCIPPPEPGQEPEALTPEPSLTLTERMTWHGLQWHLRRQKPRIGSDEAAETEASDS